MTTMRSHMLLQLLATSVVVCQLLKPASSFSTSRSNQLERLLGNLDDIEVDEEPRDDNGYEEAVNRVMKRENKGTCTCTCETRPVAAHPDSSSAAGPTAGIIPHPPPTENRYPESAALMRTATTATKEASKPKQQQQQQQPRSDSKTGPKAGLTGTVAQRQQLQQQLKSAAVQRTSAAASSGSYGHIVKVPPAPEFDVSEHMANDVIANEPEKAAATSEDEDDAEESSKQQENPHNSNHETWSLGSRYPWERLPDSMCFREQCGSDRDCCRRFNICDRSARVCVDCWYGSTCTSERDCCLKYKYCQREWKPNASTGKLEIVGGKCVSEL